MQLLRDFAYVRSGDKGDVVSVGVIARTPRDYPVLLASLTPANVKALFGDWVQGDVEIYPMDNIDAVVVIMRRALGGGATRTLRLDQTGKAMGNGLLRLPAVLPRAGSEAA
ncbi:AtuA-related protein [Xanthobacter wiegelii]|uniref:AtuA-related protein n=1 Tax=Xanthobacter wiegelii TaxID=3119913 RepID=UPI00372710CB